ncbi:MAG: hypothetical protein HN348_00550, partial [Proteobacteria bacterium]|nr:hypothetical protein [Pseudomonadota bacterium]
LSTPPHTLAWSNPTARQTYIISTEPGQGLPPPLDQLFSISDYVTAELAGGGEVVSLEGGMLHSFAAFDPSGAIGLAFTTPGAIRALEHGLIAMSERR